MTTKMPTAADLARAADRAAIDAKRSAAETCTVPLKVGPTPGARRLDAIFTEVARYAGTSGDLQALADLTSVCAAACMNAGVDLGNALDLFSNAYRAAEDHIDRVLDLDDEDDLADDDEDGPAGEADAGIDAEFGDGADAEAGQ